MFSIPERSMFILCFKKIFVQMIWKKESVDEKQDFPRSADKFLKKA
jgi:hypothetical protein